MTESLRRPIHIPRGKRSKTGSRLPRSACYVTNVSPVLRARFTIQPASLSNCTIHAAGGPFGGVLSTNLSFSGGDTGFVPLAAVGNVGDEVDRAVHNLDWMATELNGDAFPEERFQRTTGHVFYTILGEPVEPWINAYGNKANAWVSALEVVCSNGWAKGMSSCDDAADAIAKAIFNAGCFHYETNRGAPQLTTGKGRFRLSRAINRIVKNKDQEVNCSDCARLTTSFANLLGCSLFSSKMRQDFQLNPISAIGRDPWTPPGWGWSFSFHEVAWANDCLSSDKVFDACLLLDGDASPSTAPHSSMHATNIPFSDGNPAAPFVYKERLTAPGSNGYDKCHPSPYEKIRVPIQ